MLPTVLKQVGATAARKPKLLFQAGVALLSLVAGVQVERNSRAAVEKAMGEAEEVGTHMHPVGRCLWIFRGASDHPARASLCKRPSRTHRTPLAGGASIGEEGSAGFAKG